MTISALLLLALSAHKRETIRLDISAQGLAVGLASALLLYAFLWLGYGAVKSVPGFAQQVSWVYQLRGDTPIAYISLALFFLIGPAEELYWRGLIQGHLKKVTGQRRGLTLTISLYTLIHWATFNPSLMLVALIGGTVWGIMFESLNDLFPVVVSHVFFDELVFVLLPIS